ncbi:spore cortex-lytic enzyme [Paenibacillus koleovorans]|uniref:spore cortex-lytic enzyme n=1 Tax=Paenibacillus koleovorans TaxID=121608 RepID=UPI000FD823F1|nr:spore cortex-lytic enzyme [Paenibacillus koleovorans]
MRKFNRFEGSERWRSHTGWTIALGLAVLLLAALLVPQATYSFGSQILRYGAQGTDVRELQGRLQYLDYYRGRIDGDFGSQTLRAVKDFQFKFGMKVDGVVGPQTKVRLYNATKSWAPGAAGPGQSTVPPASSAFSDQDKRIMAQAVYGEARGEPYIGQVAVAAVILNRVRSSSFPNTISGVIFQPGAFTAVADGQIWLTPNDVSLKAVNDAINGWDPTGEALYYFNPDTATSAWIWTRPQIKKIGKHIFCK